jgi:hypothetical protein
MTVPVLLTMQSKKLLPVPPVFVTVPVLLKVD